MNGTRAMHVFCAHCGAENAAHARFCRSCRKLIALPGGHRPLPGPPSRGPAQLPASGVPMPPYPPAWPTPRHLPTPAPYPLPGASRPPPYPPPVNGIQPSRQPTTPPFDLYTVDLPPEVMPDRQPAPQLLGEQGASDPTQAIAQTPLFYRIDPVTGLPYDPNFKPEPLPPEGTRGMPATFFPRMGALLVDYCILSVLWFCLIAVAAFLDSAALGLLVTFFGPALYFILFWALDGKTPGHRAAGLQLIHSDGSKVGLGASIVRYIGSMISWPVFCLGYLWMLWDPDRQTWHDKMADTMVVHS